jgi:hypothetical protein
MSGNPGAPAFTVTQGLSPSLAQNALRSGFLRKEHPASPHSLEKNSTRCPQQSL